MIITDQATEEAPGIPTNPEPHPLLITVDEAAKMLSICKTTVYALISAGEIASIKIGRARRIRVSDLERWVLDQDPADIANASTDEG